jgi:hypothetical protein
VRNIYEKIKQAIAMEKIDLGQWFWRSFLLRLREWSIPRTTQLLANLSSHACAIVVPHPHTGMADMGISWCLSLRSCMSRLIWHWYQSSWTFEEECSQIA